MAEGVAAVHELPAKIGRHAVVGYLATGGMAEIFLGKEPSGRPVVIKRILPHLARQGNFVSMFIDEARIGSQVRHPNVVEVYELGQVGFDLFMVMEYLDGESTSGIMRRLHTRDERLALALAAYVVAEACAGLHAAHSLQDDAGNPLGLVHRDVSPSNIFVTYTGDVKVLDFGIATAAHRLTRTATGQVKGKFSYMSPEQCRGEPLDLRSDIFSLGVVLYELTTHRRLFKRSNELMVLKAVTEDPIPRPRRRLVDYPAILERICMRALERDKDRRHASALELREELLAAITTLGFIGDPRQALAERMAELFADRISEKRRMLHHVRLGSEVGVLPSAEVDENVEVPQLEERSSTALPSSHESRRRHRVWLVAAVAFAVSGAGIATWQIATSGPDVPAAAGAPPAVTGDAHPAITVHVDTVPPGATLFVDGAAKGATPLDFELPARRDVALRLELAGYTAVAQQLAIDHDQRILIPLAQVPTVPPPAVAPPATPVPPTPPAHKHHVKPNDPFERFD